MDWKNKLQGAGDTVIQEHWPKVQTIFQEKVGPAALSAAQDDQKMEQAFKVAYLALPFPIKMIIKEDAFIKFCFGHRNELLPPKS